MSDYAFFEYQAKLTNTGHAEDGGEPVHCMIRMKNVDREGKGIHDIELHQQTGDNVLLPPSWGLRDLFLQRLMIVKCAPITTLG
jgi:hypothetical protein